jgi:cell division transport system permease protein
MIKMALLSFQRNGWLSLAATLVMVLTLFIISSFFIFSFTLNSAIQAVNEKMDLSVYLKDEASPAEVESLKIRLSNMTDVKEVHYTSKQEALDAYKAEHKSNQDLLNAFSENENPLPASLEIKMIDPSKIENTVSVMEEDQYKPIISKISYHDNGPTIKKITLWTSYIKKAGIVFSIIFIIISILIIFNTIRIAIYARRDEIEIMKLVGATSWFIRGPFILEGMFYGIIATVVNFFIFYPVVYGFSQSFMKFVGDYGINPIAFYNHNLILIIPAQLLIGIFLGVFSSFIALRKYLA